MKPLLCLLTVLLASCRLYAPLFPTVPETARSNAPLFAAAQYHSSSAQSPFWWNSFEQKELNALISLLLKQNLSMKAAVYRLQQSRAQESIQKSLQYPEIAAGISSSRNRSERPGSQITGVDSAPDFMRIFNTFGVGARVSYEADLWRRLDSIAEAATLQSQAGDEELQRLVSILIADTARNWIELRLQSSLEELIEAQIETSATYLSLTKLRFGMGLTNGLDVLQQEQQLAGLQSLLPAMSQQKARAHSTLATLLGVPRSNLTLFPATPGLLKLPPFPSHLRAQDLFERRPDLLSLQKQAFAAEYQIAARFAERFPQIGVNLSYNFSTEDLDVLFESESGLIGLDANIPLTDGGRRRAQVRQAEARSKELLQLYIEQFIAAANEVATVSDIEELKILKLEKIALRYEASQNTLKYSRERYQNGALEYLQVLLALQTVQEVERIQLEEQARLLQNRVTLHQALGQPWRVRLKDLNDLELYIPERKSDD